MGILKKLGIVGCTLTWLLMSAGYAASKPVIVDKLLGENDSFQVDLTAPITKVQCVAMSYSNLFSPQLRVSFENYSPCKTCTSAGVYTLSYYDGTLVLMIPDLNHKPTVRKSVLFTNVTGSAPHEGKLYVRCLVYSGAED